MLRHWDSKIRDQVLRALPNYRHCPHCGGKKPSNNETKGFLAGGGFVTPECLNPHYQQREDTAQTILSKIEHSRLPLLMFYVIFVLSYCKWRSGQATELIDIFNLLVVPTCITWKMGQWIAHVVAMEARKAMSKPIVVECPCCHVQACCCIFVCEYAVATNRKHKTSDTFK